MPSMEEILGQTIEQERAIPGTRPGENEKVRYVSFSEPATPSDAFKEVPWRIKPPLPKRGGVVLEGCILTLPDGTRFCALSFHGDVEGWQNQIERGAAELGLLSARLDGDVLHLSNGRTVPLADCTIELD